MSIRAHLKEHKFALVCAAVAGIISVFPHLVFKLSLGREYKGIYLMQTANELEYLGRIQEIKDGHWTLGSVAFLEYKDNAPLVPPNILELLTAFSSKYLNVSIASVLIFSKFLLPALFFLLIYFLISDLTEEKKSLSHKTNAVACGFFIVLGYDLIDYRTVLNYLKGALSPGDFLIWTRPINPILGAILIYAFLLVISRLYKNFDEISPKKRHVLTALAGITFGLAITSYFFSWAILLSATLMLIALSFIQKRYSLAGYLILAIIAGLILASPYLYSVFSSFGLQMYVEAAERAGLFAGHSPIINKVLLLSLIAFLILSFFRGKKIVKERWWQFSLIMLLAGFLAFNQQVVTGKTVWPFHFAQYTIPLSLTALFIIFYNNFRERFSYFWSAAIGLSIFASAAFGIYTQVSTYRNSYAYYRESQKFADLFDWINENIKKDCVILSRDHEFLNRALLAYTHCNAYLSTANTYLIPFSRLYSGYLVSLALGGVKSENIEEYLNRQSRFGAVYLYGVDGLLYGSKSPSFNKIKHKIVRDYGEMSRLGVNKEIMKYKLDYILIGNRATQTEKELVKDLKKIYSSGEFSLYAL